MKPDHVYGAAAGSDENIVVRCSCAGGCLLAFDRWDGEDGPDFYGEIYTGIGPRSWGERLRGAWTCLRGREHVVSSMVLSEGGAHALGEFLSAAASRDKEQS